ncbi:DUF4388 domain-containing protein [Deinococcus soli (ex Cha et al. 2016)]|uniref:DUF4388 domain-containing protein n=1 Tax=Deinococcus soli (ex Cha et al. 2016) TaxID=1309411 RepID=UPI00166D8F3A|nr:DUF4388 domain-containing protein [Deinococcus soli (ex Cha et al. 2016)]GGB64011.1 hypothetical protein GCM10008019_20070 [Deinococcus soli (ex Cha et al. 2016)]
MTKSTASLETFDFLELLYLLSEQGRSGALYVFRPDGRFEAWLEGGRVRHLQLAEDVGVAALVRLMRDPIGRFHFDEGVTHPDPRLNASLDEVTLEALEALPVQDLPFDGPARITSPDRVQRMRWSMKELDVLKMIDAQKPVKDLVGDPDVKRMLLKLVRIGLLVPRRSRTARLVVTVTRQVRDVVLVDDLIFKRWKEDIVRHPQFVAVRGESGKVFSLPVRVGSNLTTQLMIPPELLMRTSLRAGESVLVKPV